MIYGNNMGIGCTIAFLHDIADIFGCCVKCASTMKSEMATVFCMALCMTSWFWTRLYVLPQYIYEIFMAKDDYIDSFNMSFCLINGFFLGILQVLHIYWFCLFIKMIRHKLKTGKSEDLQNQSTKKKEQ